MPNRTRNRTAKSRARNARRSRARRQRSKSRRTNNGVRVEIDPSVANALVAPRVEHDDNEQASSGATDSVACKIERKVSGYQASSSKHHRNSARRSWGRPRSGSRKSAQQINYDVLLLPITVGPQSTRQDQAVGLGNPPSRNTMCGTEFTRNNSKSRRSRNVQISRPAIQSRKQVNEQAVLCGYEVNEESGDDDSSRVLEPENEPINFPSIKSLQTSQTRGDLIAQRSSHEIQSSIIKSRIREMMTRFVGFYDDDLEKVLVELLYASSSLDELRGKIQQSDLNELGLPDEIIQELWNLANP